ncbi:MAG: nucleotidyltransferase domain-containing protein [Thermoproteus sp.]
MALDRWIEISRARSREISRLAASFVEEACRKGDVVLFGSRARGTWHALSDWDLALLVRGGEYRVESREFGQVFYIPLEGLGEVLRFSMVVLDIAHDGVLLCGRGDLWQEFRASVYVYIRERGLVRTEAGWFPKF